LGHAITLYLFGGEKYLRTSFDKMETLNKYHPNIEKVIERVKRIALKESKLLDLRSSLPELIRMQPWSRLQTISDEYAQLNRGLHEDSTVLYGYKGHLQADLIASLAEKNWSILDYGAGKRTLSKRLRELGFK